MKKAKTLRESDMHLQPGKNTPAMKLPTICNNALNIQAEKTNLLHRHCVAVAILAASLAGCGTLPVARTDGHLQNDASTLNSQVDKSSSAAAQRGSVPEPVRQVPLPPPPKPRIDEVKYSVTVKDVPVQELMFAISRDTKANIDIHPGIEGRVTLNAIDQTLKQILTRVSKQVDMRWEVDGPNIVVRPDSPYLKIYKVDYVNMTRDTTSSIGVETQVVGPNLAGAGGATGCWGTEQLDGETSKYQQEQILGDPRKKH